MTVAKLVQQYDDIFAGSHIRCITVSQQMHTGNAHATHDILEIYKF